jgi:hypothetical protein
MDNIESEQATCHFTINEEDAGTLHLYSNISNPRLCASVTGQQNARHVETHVKNIVKNKISQGCGQPLANSPNPRSCKLQHANAPLQTARPILTKINNQQILPTSQQGGDLA